MRAEASHRHQVVTVRGDQGIVRQLRRPFIGQRQPLQLDESQRVADADERAVGGTGQVQVLVVGDVHGLAQMCVRPHARERVVQGGHLSKEQGEPGSVDRGDGAAVCGLERTAAHNEVIQVGPGGSSVCEEG